MPTASEHVSPRRRDTDRDAAISIARRGAPCYTFGQKELSFLDNHRPFWGNVPGMVIAGNQLPQNATPGPGHYQALETPTPAAGRRKRGGFDSCVEMESFRSRAPQWGFAHSPAMSEAQAEESAQRKLKHDPPGPGYYHVYGDFPAEGDQDAKNVTILSTRARNPRWSMPRTHAGGFRTCWLDKQALRTTARPSFEHEQQMVFGEEASRRAVKVDAPSWSMGGRRREAKSEDDKDNAKGGARHVGFPGPGHYRTYGMFS